jgi:Gram-negative bacterial TonB protein C-terminal
MLNHGKGTCHASLLLKSARLPLAYQPMRIPAILLATLFVVVDLAQAQSIDVASNRPAMVGSGADALVNKIDVEDLFKKGQKDGAVMFACIVDLRGNVAWNTTYNLTPNAKLLEEEVLKRLETAKFVPALHNKQPVDIVFFGTVSFVVKEGKPHLRVFANQEIDEVNKASDFIGPQPYFGGESKFTGLHYPTQNMVVPVTGDVKFTIAVDAIGNLKDIQLVSESPPLLGFGDAAISDFGRAKFIPAFRDGKATDSRITLSVYFEPPEE